MLEGVFVIVYKVIIIVRIAEEYISLRKDIFRIYIRLRQTSLLRVGYVKYITVFVLQVSAMFVPQVGRCSTIAHYFTRRFNSCRSMICSNE
ncbi:hypothetical protein D3C72_947540 [compost metagenome]